VAYRPKNCKARAVVNLLNLLTTCS